MIDRELIDLMIITFCLTITIFGTINYLVMVYTIKKELKNIEKPKKKSIGSEEK